MDADHIPQDVEELQICSSFLCIMPKKIVKILVNLEAVLKASLYCIVYGVVVSYEHAVEAKWRKNEGKWINFEGFIVNHSLRTGAGAGS